MTCTRIPFEGGVAIVCSRGHATRARDCAFCGQPTLPYKLCDFPLRGKKAGATCSKPMCDKCATAIGDNRDLCPPHMKMAREHNLDIKLLAEDLGNAGKQVALDQLEQNGAPVTPKARAAAVANPIKFRARSVPGGSISAAADWSEYLTERAAIFEYLGELPRVEAEQRAREITGARPRR